MSRYTVLDAARDRISRVFEDFDNIVVAFSGGKDSGVMLELVLDHMRTHNIDRKVTVMHLDYEGQYQATTDYVTEVMTSNLDLIEPVWLCLPVAAACAVSMYQDRWTPWNPAERDLWVRELPDAQGVIHADNVPDGFPEFLGRDDYDVQRDVTIWLHERAKAKRTAVLVGIRQQESLHRYWTVRNTDKKWLHKGYTWTTGITPDVFNVYPIHDWQTEDVWTANAKFGWRYNKLYDLMHQAGLTIHQMRVASPFRSEGQDNLKLYRVIEPEMWAKLVGRVNGANFTAVYGGSAAMGARHITLPPGHTWKTYVEFLLSTLPAATRENYERKFAVSIRNWTEKGGGVEEQTLQQIEACGVPFENLGPSKKKIKFRAPREVIRFEDYPDDLPEVKDFWKVPTWKRMAITILRNDHTCKGMHFGPTKREAELRKQALDKYKEIL